MGKTIASATPGRSKPVTGKASINSKTTTASASASATTSTTTTPDRVENNDIDFDSDVDDSDSDIKPAATSGRISMTADDDLSDGDTAAVMEDLSPDLDRFMSQELQHGATAAAEALDYDLVVDDDDDDYAPPFWAYTDGRAETDSTTSETNNNEIVVRSPSQAPSRFPATKSATRHLELTKTYIPDLHRKPAAAASSPKTKTNRRGRPLMKGNNKRKCEWIDMPILESQKEKDELLKVGDVVYAPYPGKCPLKESTYRIDLCATIVQQPNLHKLLRMPLIC
jgi:hypothetical protein